MLTVILMLLVSVVSSSAFAEWMVLGVSNETKTNYVNPTTVRNADSRVKMWSLSDFKSIQVIAGRSFLSSKDQYEYDCEQRRARLLFFVNYSGNMGAGAVTLSSTVPAPDWDPIPPDTVLDQMWEFACGKK